MFKPDHVSDSELTPSRMRTLVSRRVVLFEFTNPFQELLRPPFLEHAHERRAQSFACIGRHLGHCRLGSLSLLNVATGDLLELEVSRNVGGNQNVCQLAVRHQKLGHQVHVPVVDTAILLPRFLAGADVAIFLEELQKQDISDGSDIKQADLQSRCSRKQLH